MVLKNLGISLLIIIIILSLYLQYLSKRDIKTEKFQSYRLGNMIDLWYFSTITKNKEAIYNLNSFDTKNKDSFSIFLIKNKYLVKNIENYNKEKDFLESFPSYYYKNIVKCVNNFHHNLRYMMEKYNKIHQKVLFNQDFEDENHCVIHYRLGDVVTLGDVIDYQSLIDTIKDLSINLSVIEIMDGGKNHHPLRVKTWSRFKKTLFKEDKTTSEKIYHQFYQKLKLEFPDTKIIQSEKRTTDEDFFRMSSAPILVTGGGSYALAAAVASKSRIIRTPSCKTLDFPSKGPLENMVIKKENCDWKTYQYKML